MCFYIEEHKKMEKERMKDHGARAFSLALSPSNTQILYHMHTMIAWKKERPVYMFYGNHFLFPKGKMTPVMICQNNPTSTRAMHNWSHRLRASSWSSNQRASTASWAELGFASNWSVTRCIETLRRFLLHRVVTDTSIGDNRLFLSNGSMLSAEKKFRLWKKRESFSYLVSLV